MALTPQRATRVQAKSIPGLVRELTPIDAKIPDVRARLERAAKISALGNSSVCIIDITCCIIDCTKCRPDDMSIYENPATILEEFAFKLHDQAKNPDAPVYYVPEGKARDAFKVGHQAMKIPGGHAAGRVIGLAGEIFGAEVLKSQHIAATAPVIAVVPAATG